MSKIAIKGATTGTGVFTLESPATNTNRTLVLPDEAGTVLTSASNVAQKGVPVVRVKLSANQTISNSTWTKVQFDTKDFDTDNFFDATTNYRFQPTVAGYYLIATGILVSQGAQTAVLSYLYKNGASYSAMGYAYFSSQSLDDWQVKGTTLVYCNGSTDYVELYGLVIGSSPHFYGSSVGMTCLEAVLVRAD